MRFFFLYQIPDLKALYDTPYESDTTTWRRLGAADKAAHINEMLGDQLASSNSVLEVGCGTGDVSAILASQYPNTQFVGVEIGQTRTNLDDRLTTLSNLSVTGYDGATLPFDDKSFDIVFATHVIEHVVNERMFLHELRRVTRQFVFIEAPCEQVFLLNSKRIQRTLNIGHINSYSPESLALLIETSGLEVIDTKMFDPSWESQKFLGGRAAPVKFALRRGLLTLSPRLAAKVFTYHMAAVAKPSSPLNIS